MVCVHIDRYKKLNIKKNKIKKCVGVDLGINKMATISAAKPLKTNLRKLARFQRKLKKKIYQSKNLKKRD